MANEVEILSPALETALAAWEIWKKGKSILAQYPPDAEIIDPLAQAIEACDAFKAVVGRPIFSGYSGVVLFGSTLAIPLLYRADPEYGKGIQGGIDWLLKILTTSRATGTYSVAIWGLMPDAEVEIVKGCLVQPFEPAPASPIKRRVSDLMQKSWDGSVWHSARFYDAPGAIMTKMVEGFPYLGRPDKSFSLLTDLDGKTKALLAFLQASVTRQPLVGASWFCYEDEDLDFNSHENHLSWCVPEVEPIVRRNVPVKADHLAGTAAALARLPEDWRDKLVRSTERFVLSQCRYQPVDRALDLAIAFEILTTGGKGDNAPPNWKVSVRSAQLIGGPLARRQHIRDLLGALYKIRNTGSHGGSLKASEATEQDAVLGECGTIYQSLVDDVLAIGTGPVWSDLELEHFPIIEDRIRS